VVSFPKFQESLTNTIYVFSVNHFDLLRLQLRRDSVKLTGAAIVLPV
jgi:hypothetical protein